MRSLGKRWKILIGLLALGLLIGAVWYAQLSDRHQAIVKTTLLHTFHLIDPDWEVNQVDNRVSLHSPELLVDDLYQSMDGPQAMINLDLNEEGSELQWITGFKTQVFREGTDAHNNDFLCHTNLDYYDAVHYTGLEMPKRINTTYPRLGTLSNGINEVRFPKGFGFPIPSNDALIVASRTLNQNIEDPWFKVRHRIDLDLAKPGEKMKPLLPKGLVLMLPYDLDDPYGKDPKDPNLCSPIDLKNHSGPGPDGTPLSAHWVLPQGRSVYEFEVTYQLWLQEDTTIHTMAAHLHPGAQTFTLYDMTDDREVYRFDCRNYSDKIGLEHVPYYSDEKGIELKADHRYKLILETENPSNDFRDMMAVLFVYVHDLEMERHLASKGLLP